MDYKLKINNTVVGEITMLGGEYPSNEGLFSPNENFVEYEEIYNRYNSDDQDNSDRGEAELEMLHFSLIDEFFLIQDVAYMFIHNDFKCYWRNPGERKYVEFYRINEYPYGCFSNFSKHPIEIEGKIYPTSEHYFQAMKFAGMSYEKEISLAGSAALAAKLGNSRKYKIRGDWDTVKEDIMYIALKAKFTQNNECYQLLMQTQDAKLIEHTSNDSYWADGGNGKGLNRLGILLMKLRDDFF